MATLNAEVTAKPARQSAGQDARLYGRRGARRYAKQIPERRSGAAAAGAFGCAPDLGKAAEDRRGPRRSLGNVCGVWLHGILPTKRSSDARPHSDLPRKWERPLPVDLKLPVNEFVPKSTPLTKNCIPRLPETAARWIQRFVCITPGTSTSCSSGF